MASMESSTVFFDRAKLTSRDMAALPSATRPSALRAKNEPDFSQPFQSR